MRPINLMPARWAAALIAVALATSARATPRAKAVIASAAGKLTVEGTKFSELNARHPLLVLVSGPGQLTLGLRAVGPARRVRYEIFLDGRRHKVGWVERSRASHELAGPERTVSLDIARGNHKLKVTARGGDAAVRVVEPAAAELALSAPPPPPDLPPIVAPAVPPPAPKSPPASRFETITAQGLETPPATKKAASAAPAPMEGSSPSEWHVHVDPFAAMGEVNESGFSSPYLPGLGAGSSQFELGASALATHGALSLLGEVRDGFYHRQYVTRWGGPSGDLPKLDLDEQNLAFGATVGYEVLHTFAPKLAEVFRISPFAGPAARMLLNDAVPQNIVGIQVGARGEWDASRSLRLSASAGWLGNWSFIQGLKYQGVPLLLGAPTSATDWEVAALIKLSGPANLRVAWDGELMTLQLAYRWYQSMSVAFDYGFM